MSHRGEAQKKTQDSLEGLFDSAGLRKPRDSPSRAGGGVLGIRASPAPDELNQLGFQLRAP